MVDRPLTREELELLFRALLYSTPYRSSEAQQRHDEAMRIVRDALNAKKEIA